MSPKAGQMSGLIGLNFFVDTHSKFFFLQFFFHGQRRALQLVFNKRSIRQFINSRKPPALAVRFYKRPGK